MSLGQIVAVILLVAAFVALIVYRTWTDRRKERGLHAAPPPAPPVTRAGRSETPPPGRA
jgi:hypothetical protein